mmetsp:Transcript_43213/g.113698  ORF Transcript_43213/g.113698 Transcript_43213/m.113698 type:complete len:218 (-) Transcript_43213:434-1087(-)
MCLMHSNDGCHREREQISRLLVINLQHGYIYIPTATLVERIEESRHSTWSDAPEPPVLLTHHGVRLARTSLAVSNHRSVVPSQYRLADWSHGLREHLLLVRLLSESVIALVGGINDVVSRPSGWAQSDNTAALDTGNGHLLGTRAQTNAQTHVTLGTRCSLRTPNARTSDGTCSRRGGVGDAASRSGRDAICCARTCTGVKRSGDAGSAGPSSCTKR